MAGLATAVAIMLYCAVWILLAWPNGSATAAFAALITCSFATQDDPAPVIGRYLVATLKTFPLSALYLFVILPRVDGYGMLIVTLAPALFWMGYIQADPRRSPEALPMLSCFIVAMGFLARFQADFATFINTGLAQVGGIVTTLAVTRLFRSANVSWTARRILQANWGELASWPTSAPLCARALDGGRDRPVGAGGCTHGDRQSAGRAPCCRRAGRFAGRAQHHPAAALAIPCAP
jgi:uncharacterized membrane protein YccC